MKRSTSIGLAAGLAAAVGFSVLFSPGATSNPFGGSDPSSCGDGQDCSASTFTATEASSGPAYAVASQLTCAVDFGPGASDCAGTNVSGDITYPNGATIRVGDSGVFTGTGSWTNTNGAINCESGCQIRDSGNGTLPINTTGGIVFNSTTPMVGFLLVDVVIDVASIDANTCNDVTATVAGVEANDGVFVTTSTTLAEDDVSVGDAHVTNAGTDEVTFRACNVAAVGADPASATYRFWVVRKA